MSKTEKKSFILYQNYENLFRVLPLHERGKLITAIFAYERDGSENTVKLSDSARMAFVCIRDTLDRDRETYRARCEQNAKNAKMSHKNRSDCKRSVANGSLNENENDTDNENEIDIDIENGRSGAPQKRAYARQKSEKKETEKRSGDLLMPNMSTFDTDDFFEAALRRSFDEP